LRRCGPAGRKARQADRFFAFLDFQFGEVRLFQQFDQFLDFAQIHDGLALEFG